MLVVGSGGAGMSAALEAQAAGASVILITKSALGASNTSRAQGGIQAAMGDGDSTQSHYADTLAAGHDAGQPELVRTLTDSGPEAIAWLAQIGVPFTRDGDTLRILRCGGASRPRLLQSGERTGAEMVKALRASVRVSGVEVIESASLRSLEPRAADNWRALVATAPGDLEIDPRAIVLAAGGGLGGEAKRIGIGSWPSCDRLF